MAVKPVIHGGDHRPPGWNGPDDRGGSDPAYWLADGIQFNKDNQGGYLDITTNDVDADGFGMHFVDASGGGILFEAASGTVGLSLGVDVNPFLELFSQGPMLITTLTTGAGITIDAHDSAGIGSEYGDLFLGFGNQDATKSLYVKQGGTTLLRIDGSDGSIHGLASVGAITWDL